MKIVNCPYCGSPYDDSYYHGVCPSCKYERKSEEPVLSKEISEPASQSEIKSDTAPMINQNVPQYPQQVPRTSGTARALKIIISLAGVAFGIILICGAFEVNVYGDYPSSYTFGADFYTEIYGAARDVARNTSSMGRAVSTGFNDLFKIIGCISVLFWGYKFFDTIEN